MTEDFEGICNKMKILPKTHQMILSESFKNIQRWLIA